MSKLYVISDLHLDHKKILEFSPKRGGTNVEEHNEWIVESWNSVVTKRDTVIVLGDVAFSVEALDKYMPRMAGNKVLVRGNHDKFDLGVYLKYFSNVYGLVKKRGFWLSHPPIHPQELRGRKNIHGHVHSATVPDDHYINACVEACNGVPMCFDDLGDPVFEKKDWYDKDKPRDDL